MLYLLLGLVRRPGRELRGTGGGVLVPAPFMPARLLLDRLVLLEERVVAGDCLSNHELRVEEDLLRFCGVSATSPSLLELPDDGPLSGV